jgi:hypothetical protein
MKKIILLLVCLFSLFFNGSSQVLTFPFTVQPPVIDGKFTQGEWKGAKQISLDSVTLYFLSSDKEIFIGVQGQKGIHPYTDLYFKTDSILNLHASLQLGERNLLVLADPVEWSWGNNRLWTASVVTYKKNAGEKQSFYEQVEQYDGQEFVIQKNRFRGVTEIKLKIIVGDFINANSGARYPAGEAWMEINMR